LDAHQFCKDFLSTNQPENVMTYTVQDDIKLCPICLGNNDSRASHGDGQRIVCPRCGDFSISRTALEVWNAGQQYTPRQVANASAWLHENPGTALHSRNLQDILELTTPPVGERAEKLIVEVERMSKFIGDTVEIPYDDFTGRKWLSVSWSQGWEELDYLLKNYLCERAYWLNEIARSNGGFHACITPAGYEFLEKRRQGKGNGDQGFCAMWFNEEVTTIWTDAISPAIAAAGYRPVRIDLVQHNNRIDDEILAQIRRSRFVIADFTGQRGGVYFEAGFALGLNLPVIWAVREDSLADVHFDNRQYNFLQWRLDDLPAFRKALQNRIEATLGRGPVPADKTNT